VRPERFQFQLAPRAIDSQRKNPPAICQTLREIGVEFSRDLAAAALRFDDAGDGDELVAYSRISRA
jgi:hypothetical protein